MYRRYTFGSNEAEWSEAEALVDLSSPLEATGFDIAMNAMGEAILLWEQSGDGKQVYAQVYAPGQDKELNENGWSSADTLIGEGHGSNDAPQVVMSQNGKALAIWVNGGNTLDAQFFK